MSYCKLQHVSKHDLLRLNYEAPKHVNSRWGRSRKINPRWSISHSRSGHWNLKMQGPRSPEVLRPPVTGINLRVRWREDVNLQHLTWCRTYAVWLHRNGCWTSRSKAGVGNTLLLMGQIMDYTPSLDCFKSVDKASEGNQMASVAHRQTAPPQHTHKHTQTLIAFAFRRSDLAVSDRLEHCYSWLQMSRTFLCPSLISANIVTNSFKGQTRLLNLLIHT